MTQNVIRINQREDGATKSTRREEEKGLLRSTDDDKQVVHTLDIDNRQVIN